MVEIRTETPENIAAIYSVHEACFPEHTEARLVDALRSGGHLLVSLVAWDGDDIVGHIAFSPVTADNGATGAGLAPVSVIEAYRRQGIAARLIEAGLSACRDSGYGWVVVLGEPDYYRRFSFAPAAEFGLCDEYGGGPAFQVLELVDGSAPRGAGLIRYGPEFASLA